MEQQLPVETEPAKVRTEGLKPLSVLPPIIDEQGCVIEEAADVSALLETFTFETKRRRRILEPLGILQVVGLNVLLFLLLYWTLIRKLTPSNLWVIPTMAALFLLPVGLTATFLALSKPSRKQRQILEYLCHSKDVRAIGPLLRGVSVQNRKIRQAVCKNLTLLLLRLKPEEVPLLSDPDLQRLYTILDISTSNYYQKFMDPQREDLAVAMLQVVGQTGDSRVLETVVRVATEEASTDAQKRIRQAASGCLPLLRERIEQESARQNLLSPADDPNAPADNLLRPAQDASQTDPNVLLRPSITRGNDPERRGNV